HRAEQSGTPRSHCWRPTTGFLTPPRPRRDRQDEYFRPRFETERIDPWSGECRTIQEGGRPRGRPPFSHSVARRQSARIQAPGAGVVLIQEWLPDRLATVPPRVCAQSCPSKMPVKPFRRKAPLTLPPHAWEIEN